jgi:N-acetylglucosaminyldiphosphoundecaprenol N-acetyl-beta-D-mannosaminyltransferase
MPRLMGMPVDAVTLREAVAAVVDGVAQGSGGIVVTPNVDILRQYRSSSKVRSEFERADLLVADGMPIVMALRLQRTPVPHQITGTDLVRALCVEAAARGHSVMLAGGRPGDASRAADVLRGECPGLLAQTRACFVRPDTEAREIALLSDALVAARPDVVFIGLPFLSQIAAMSAFREKLPATWFIGVGSSFELINGDRTRPPRVVQLLCLEWLWRLAAQPSMWRRYVIQGMPIAARLVVAALLVRWQPESKRQRVFAPRST